MKYKLKYRPERVVGQWAIVGSEDQGHPRSLRMFDSSRGAAMEVIRMNREVEIDEALRFVRLYRRALEHDSRKKISRQGLSNHGIQYT